MTVFDAELKYAAEQALTATADSENILNLSANRDIGMGSPMWLVVLVNETFVSGGNSTLDATLVTDDNEAFSSSKTLLTMAQVAKAAMVAGAVLYKERIPRGFEQYSKMVLTVGTANFTAGKLTIGIVNDVEDIKYLPIGNRVIA